MPVKSQTRFSGFPAAEAVVYFELAHRVLYSNPVPLQEKMSIPYDREFKAGVQVCKYPVDLESARSSGKLLQYLI